MLSRGSRGAWIARAICTRLDWESCNTSTIGTSNSFLHHPFNADSLSEVGRAESFAEIYWEDKIMPYVNPLYANDSIAKSGVQVADAQIYRCMSDTSIVQPYVNPSTGQIDGITNRTSYLLNSQLSHKTIRYEACWNFPRFPAREIGTSNFVCMGTSGMGGNVMDANITDPVAATDLLRQDDYDIWLGTGDADGQVDCLDPAWDVKRAVPRWSRQVGAQARRLSGHVSGRGDSCGPRAGIPDESSGWRCSCGLGLLLTQDGY